MQLLVSFDKPDSVYDITVLKNLEPTLLLLFFWFFVRVEQFHSFLSDVVLTTNKLPDLGTILILRSKRNFFLLQMWLLLTILRVNP